MQSFVPTSYVLLNSLDMRDATAERIRFLLFMQELADEGDYIAIKILFYHKNNHVQHFKNFHTKVISKFGLKRQHAFYQKIKDWQTVRDVTLRLKGKNNVLSFR